MAAYPRLDPYNRSRYEQGIDAKIVVMGNTGMCRGQPAGQRTGDLTQGILSGVGKTSLLQRYTQNKFDPKNTTSTTGAFFVTKKVVVHGLKVRLQLWDTAGQERFRSMVSVPASSLLCFSVVTDWTYHDVTVGTYVLSRGERCTTTVRYNKCRIVRRCARMA